MIYPLKDVECFGRKNVSTPHINSLAARGVKLTQWISAAPICTPSRVALQTGRLATRIGMTANVLPFRVFDWPVDTNNPPLATENLLEDTDGLRRPP